LSLHYCGVRASDTPAVSVKPRRTMASPHLGIRPLQSTAPEASRRGVSPHFLGST
jgi:hypothetical protein